LSSTISNIIALKNAGFFSDRNGHSENLNFRKFNLIYGFNGSGKSTLSRIFASLELGGIHPNLPKDCTFEVMLSDGALHSVPDKPAGIEQRVMVFNSGFTEKNFHWFE
jgi:wobble nucleotide-excising tRNase